MMKTAAKKISKYEGLVNSISASMAIIGKLKYKGIDYSEIDLSLMTKREKEKHLWILETQRYQRISKTPEDDYVHLSKVWEEDNIRKSGRVV